MLSGITVSSGGQPFFFQRSFPSVYSMIYSIFDVRPNPELVYFTCPEYNDNKYLRQKPSHWQKCSYVNTWMNNVNKPSTAAVANHAASARDKLFPRSFVVLISKQIRSHVSFSLFLFYFLQYWFINFICRLSVYYRYNDQTIYF